MTATQNAICSQCQRPLRGYFKIDHVAVGGHTLISANLCSLACVFPWAYAYGRMLGTMGAMRVKGTVDNLLDAIRSLLPP